MSATLPQKIVLDKSTKVSLNDRFTKFTKERLQNRKQIVKIGPNKIVGNAKTGLKQQQRVATAKNRRLAQQMANRPSVQAALRLKKRSIKQRVAGTTGVRARIGGRPGLGAAKTKRLGRGATIKARLNRSASQTPNIKSRLSGIKRSNTNSPASVINRTTNAGQRLNKNIQRRNALNASGKFGHLKSSLKSHFIGPNRVQGGNVPTKFNNSGRLSGRIKAKQQRIRGRLTRGGRRNRGFKNGQQQQQQQQKNPVATKESLDKDLDQYMLKSKSRLDNDLDAYMSQAN